MTARRPSRTRHLLSEHRLHLVRREWRCPAMDHRMAVRADGDQVLRRIDQMGVADAAERFEVMDVDDARSSAPVGILKAQSAHQAAVTAGPNAKLSNNGVPLVFASHDLMRGPFFHRVRGSLEQPGIRRGRLLAVVVHLGRIGLVKRVRHHANRSIPERASRRGSASSHRLASRSGERVNVSHRGRVRRGIGADARAVAARGRDFAFAKPAQFKRCGNEHVVPRNLNGSRGSLRSHLNLNDNMLGAHSDQQSTEGE